MIRTVKRFIWALMDYDSFKAFYDNQSESAMKQLKKELTAEDWKVINSRFYYAWVHARAELHTKRERKKTK